MQKVISSSIIALLVASCGPSMNFVENKTDYELCYGLAKYPSYNINTKNRKAEIRKRGVNCKKYEAKIDKQLAQERLASASAPVYRNTTSNSDRALRRELEELDSNLQTQCILNGGVYGGSGMCF